MIDMDCILWRGAHNRDGYGTVKIAQKVLYVHRLAYIAFYGEIPAGCEIDHLCSVKDCVNPLHLDAVPHGTNMRRWMAQSTRVGTTWERRSA